MAQIPPGPWLVSHTLAANHQTILPEHKHHEHHFQKYLPKFLRHEPKYKSEAAKENEAVEEVRQTMSADAEEEARRQSEESNASVAAEGEREEQQEKQRQRGSALDMDMQRFYWCAA